MSAECDYNQLPRLSFKLVNKCESNCVCASIYVIFGLSIIKVLSLLKWPLFIETSYTQ
jgi:hypothetical protein